MAPALQQQMTDALSRGEHFVAESIRRTLSPIHKELLERESQLSSAKRDGEQLTPGQRKRQSKLAADLMTDMRATANTSPRASSADCYSPSVAPIRSNFFPTPGKLPQKNPNFPA
jgi:hypothetical protein